MKEKDETLRNKDLEIEGKDKVIEAKNTEIRNLKETIKTMKKELSDWAQKLQKTVLSVFKKLNSARRIAFTSPCLSGYDKNRIYRKADEITDRTEEVLEKPLETPQDYSDACDRVEVEKQRAEDLEKVADGHLKFEDIDDNDSEMDR
ncbi:MAG: hypothetical protein J1E03_06985 [Acetatifactor sp.]|nr:hypothetical protein [Acetatifactor sp.]